jgi:hypothetical protein
LRCIRERAGDVDPAALAAVAALPETYPLKRESGKRVLMQREGTKA